ncbi:UNVERIFIED_CONTAM: hypothetical protein HHA_268835 [Hammondia hammondi]|eukprot:XP_008882276.1 hypothetical protein HHA_268835 [Hammondia hammondi]
MHLNKSKQQYSELQKRRYSRQMHIYILYICVQTCESYPVLFTLALRAIPSPWGKFGVLQGVAFRRKNFSAEISHRSWRSMICFSSDKKSSYASKPHDGLASWPFPGSGCKELT